MLLSSNSSLGARIVGSLFFLAFLGMGLFFTFLVGRATWESVRVSRWEQTDCAIQESAVEEHPDAAQADEAYRFVVAYEYTFRGARYRSTRYAPGYRGSSDVTAARRLAERFPVGARVPCRVDPENPTSAVLSRPRLWIGLVILFPLLFVAVGLGGILLLWRPARPIPSDVVTQALARANPKGSRGCLLALSAGVALLGVAFGWPFFAKPALRLLASRSWPVLSCRVLASQVRSHPGDESTTYSADILYTYSVGGREYESNRYDFLGGSDSDSAGKEAIVERYPAGARVVCFVNPEDPNEAVLSRDWSVFYLIGLVPLAMVACGVFGLVKLLQGGAPPSPAARPAWLPTPQGEAGPEAFGPLELRPRQGPLGRFFGTLFVAAFWNGITGVFVWQIAASFRQGSPEWGAALFISIFVLIGLALLVAIPYSFLALWNPRPHLTLARGALRLGETVDLAWRFTGRPGRIGRLRITLEGREEVSYSSGRSSSTAREVFRTLEIADLTEPLMIAAGTVRIAVPADTMHSFAAPNNRVVWTLKVAGEIPFWPDLAEEFELAVLPQALHGAQRISEAGGGFA
jgi:uncharacterized protein DUF3592